MQHFVSYTPQQNGVAERKNRSLKEMATFLLEVRDLPPYLWVEVVKYSLCIQNSVPHKSVDEITPFKVLMGHKPNVTSEGF